MEFNATFIVSAISFIVFVIIMNAIFYKPLQKVVDERQQFIDEANEEAKFNTDKSEAILKDKEKKIKKARFDAKKIILDKTQDAKTHKSSLTSEAQKKASINVENAKIEIQKSQEEAQDALNQESEEIAKMISQKILGNI